MIAKGNKSLDLTSVFSIGTIIGKMTKKISEYKRGFIIIPTTFTLLILVILPTCRINREPEKVYNLRKKMVALTESLVGRPYTYGGEDIDGFDCSGLVQYVYDCFGIDLPRTAKKQSKLKEKIKLRNAKPADILVFKFKRRYHTAIYIGKNTFVHAPNPRSIVRKQSLSKMWKKNLKFVIRIIDE